MVDDGTIYKWIEAEQYVIELILKHENIHLYSFNNRVDITTDLNHYKDKTHYGEWINSSILHWLYEGKGLLTKENYQDYLAEELTFYTTFDYLSLNGQHDYQNDYYAEALLNYEISGAEPMDLLKSESVTLERLDEHETKIKIEDIGNYDYLVFWGKRVSEQGQPSVSVYNESYEKVAEIMPTYYDTDDEWHQYVMDLSHIDGGVTIVFSGGGINNERELDMPYLFSDIVLY